MSYTLKPAAERALDKNTEISQDVVLTSLAITTDSMSPKLTAMDLARLFNNW